MDSRPRMRTIAATRLIGCRVQNLVWTEAESVRRTTRPTIARSSALASSMAITNTTGGSSSFWPFSALMPTHLIPGIPLVVLLLDFGTEELRDARADPV